MLRPYALRLSQTFYLCTGFGAAFGVFTGQLLYASGVYAYSALVARATHSAVPTPKTLLMGLEIAALLSAAAFAAGFAWQPVVHMLVGASADAHHAAAGTS